MGVEGLKEGTTPSAPRAPKLWVDFTLEGGVRGEALSPRCAKPGASLAAELLLPAMAAASADAPQTTAQDPWSPDQDPTYPLTRPSL